MTDNLLLAGVRVIDAANFIAGPVATTIMADLGADVIKIEPPDGDPYRHRSARARRAPRARTTIRWIVDNRTKRGAGARPAHSRTGSAVLHRLVERADVFVTNAPLDSRARLRVRWEDLAPLNPRLGLRVDDRLRRARRGGRTHRLRRDGALGAHRPDGSRPRRRRTSPPARSLPGHGRSSDGHVAVRGDHDRALPSRADGPRHHGVDVAHGQRRSGGTRSRSRRALCGARVEARPPREEPASALANLYRCADGRWFLLNVLNDDRDWPQLLRGDRAPRPRRAIRASPRRPPAAPTPRALVPVFDGVFARPLVGGVARRS